MVELIAIFNAARPQQEGALDQNLAQQQRKVAIGSLPSSFFSSLILQQRAKITG